MDNVRSGVSLQSSGFRSAPRRGICRRWVCTLHVRNAKHEIRKPLSRKLDRRLKPNADWSSVVPGIVFPLPTLLVETSILLPGGSLSALGGGAASNTMVHDGPRGSITCTMPAAEWFSVVRVRRHPTVGLCLWSYGSPPTGGRGRVDVKHAAAQSLTGSSLIRKRPPPRTAVGP